MSSPQALLFLAEGAEDMETVITADILRRANISVTVASVTKNPVKCSRGIVIHADDTLDNIAKNNREFDILILPGGLGGSNNLGCSEIVGNLLKKQEANNGYIAAICAAPTALNVHGIGKGKKITSYPAVKEEMIAGGYTYSEENVVVDGKLITSRGPGTSFEFALTIVEKLTNCEMKDVIRKGLLL